MSCKGCTGNKEEKKYDSRGNVIGTPEMKQRANEQQQHAHAHEARELSYTEYLSKRAEFRAESKAVGNQKVLEFSDDYRRIQIDELISVFNLDEVHFKLTPSQALVALWEFAHHPAYQKVFDEFEGLREQVDIKYSELKSNNIKLKWKP